MGNGKHEQNVDHLQILNPNCMCMLIGLIMTKCVSVMQCLPQIIIKGPIKTKTCFEIYLSYTTKRFKEKHG